MYHWTSNVYQVSRLLNLWLFRISPFKDSLSCFNIPADFVSLLDYFVLQISELIAGSALLLDFSALIYLAYWISPLLLTVLIGFLLFYLQCLLDFSAFIYFGWLLRLLDQCFGFLRFYLSWLTSPIAGSVLLLDFSAYLAAHQSSQWLPSVSFCFRLLSPNFR